jgi:hypothetical protein
LHVIPVWSCGPPGITVTAYGGNGPDCCGAAD